MSDSEQALKDINPLPEKLSSEEKHGNLYKGNFSIPRDENSKNLKDGLGIIPTSLVSSTTDDGGTHSIPDIAVSEVEYIESENLDDLLSVESNISTLAERLNCKDWVLVCEALNNVRQLSIYHKEKLMGILDEILKLIVKCLKNPRSAVCKTAIMTSSDIFKAYNDSIIESFDPLLYQLFLKSSQDKRFVCEAAERTLITMITCFSSLMLLPKIQPYLKHKNPRIRAKASMCFCGSVQSLGMDGIQIYGIDKLIEVAITQLHDQLPESREAARSLALKVKEAYEKSQPPVVETGDSDSVCKLSWEDFCQSKLSALDAQAILRATCVVKENAPV